MRKLSALLPGLLGMAMLTACASTIDGRPIDTAANVGTSAPGGASTSGEAGTASSARKAGAASPDGMAHPCTLLHHDEAETLAGTKLFAGTESGQGDTKTLCQYVGPTTGPLAQVQILVGDGAKKILDIDRGILKHPFTTLTGIGDEAYQEDNNLFLRRGANWASINLSLLNDPSQNVTRMQAAAREVAGRLG